MDIIIYWNIPSPFREQAPPRVGPFSSSIEKKIMAYRIFHHVCFLYVNPALLGGSYYASKTWRILPLMFDSFDIAKNYKDCGCCRCCLQVLLVMRVGYPRDRKADDRQSTVRAGGRWNRPKNERKRIKRILTDKRRSK